jgi:hypothetical protein
MHAGARATCISPHASRSHLLASSCSSGKGTASLLIQACAGSPPLSGQARCQPSYAQQWSNCTALANSESASYNCPRYQSIDAAMARRISCSAGPRLVLFACRSADLTRCNLVPLATHVHLCWHERCPNSLSGCGSSRSQPPPHLSWPQCCRAICASSPGGIGTARVSQSPV